jgi:hypothetical protein
MYPATRCSPSAALSTFLIEHQAQHGHDHDHRQRGGRGIDSTLFQSSNMSISKFCGGRLGEKLDLSLLVD